MTTFPEAREALAAEHTRPLTIKFRRDGSCYLSMGDHTKGTHKAFDIAFDGRYPPDVADAKAIEATYNAAPAMLAHIDAQAAEIERLREIARAVIRDYPLGVAAIAARAALEQTGLDNVGIQRPGTGPLE